MKENKTLTFPYALSERTKALDMVRQLMIEGRQFACVTTDRFIEVSTPQFAAPMLDQPALA